MRRASPARRAAAARPASASTPLLESVRKIYGGARDGKNRLMYPGAQPRGSEGNWAGWLVPFAQGVPSNQEGFAVNTLRWLAYPDARPSMTLKDVQFTEANFREIMGRVSGIYDSTDPDLSAFRQHGGKLIMWHGEADPAVPPAGTIAYYQAVTERMGGSARTQEFARLFMLPGVAHCSGGEGPGKFNGLGRHHGGTGRSGVELHGAAPSVGEPDHQLAGLLSLGL
ncbi:tannase/feruloyl esterase family alpha/beta hydrolase [Spirillospora sp. NPDC000708]